MSRAAKKHRRQGVRAVVTPVVNGRRLTAGQMERLGEAERLASGGLSERQKAASLVRAVEAELAAARVAREVDAGIADTVARARARGEAFEVELVDVGEWRRDANGAMARRDGRPILDVEQVRRVSRVDGLASVYRAQGISDDEKRTGDAYRAKYAEAQPPMTISSLSAERGGTVDREAPMAAAMERGMAARLLGQIRAAMPADAADVLEAVAGRGETIRSLGEGGNQKVANQQRLILALSVAAPFLFGEKKDVAGWAR